MHAVLTRLKALPGEMDRVKALAADLTMPAYVENAARGAFILASCHCDEVLVLVLYATQPEAEMIECGEALRFLRDNWQLVLAEPPTSEAFEVLAGMTGGAPGKPLSGDIRAFLSDLTRSL
ncbi:MAG TPA: hypothetical protein VFH60_12410 [Chloroflexia bacterium]|nr:hypothetical protein [Chloroflexia bacterium]